MSEERKVRHDQLQDKKATSELLVSKLQRQCPLHLQSKRVHLGWNFDETKETSASMRSHVAFQHR